MKATRKRRQRKNLFEEDEEDDTQQPTQYKNLKQLNTENVVYDAAKLEQNQIYINKEEKKQGQLEEDDEDGLGVSRKNKRPHKNKKKNLFEESDEEEQQYKISDKKNEENEEQEFVVHEKKQKNIISESNSDEDKDEEDEDQECEIQYMVEKAQQKTKTEKQVSFQVLINEEKTIQGRKKLFVSPVQPGYRACCFFKRNSSGFSDIYQLQGEDQRTIIFCQNQRGSIGANFYFSLTKEMDKKNQNYLGKLRGNASGSTYQLYDYGIQPSKNLDRQAWRTSLAFIDYENNFMGMNGPRKFKTILPNLDQVHDLDSFKLAQNESLALFQPPQIRRYRNKQPRWNQRLKSYALNFGGRVKQASIKNFILVEDIVDPEDEVAAKNLLVFGKIDENTFSLQFSHPLSVLQAFGIAISQFDYKLNCQ